MMLFRRLEQSKPKSPFLISMLSVVYKSTLHENYDTNKTKNTSWL